MSDVSLRFGAKDDGLDAKFAKTAKQLKDLESGSSKIASLIGDHFGKLATIVGGISFAKLASQSFELAGELQRTSAQTGIAVESLQKLQFIATQTNAPVDSITRAVNAFQKQLVTGGEAASNALTSMGISMSEIARLSPDAQFERIARGISAIEDPAERTTAAMQLFGKSGADLLPVLTQTGSQMEGPSARFEQLGGPISAETIQRVDDLGNSFVQLKDNAKNLGLEFLSLAAKPLTVLIDRLGTATTAARDAAHELSFNLFGGSKEQDLKNIEKRLDVLRRFPEEYAEVIAQQEARANAIKAAIALEKQLQPPDLKLLSTDSLAPKPAAPQQQEGPRQPTPQELRLQMAQTEGSPFEDINVQILEQNQQMLDQMLKQDTAAMLERVNIQSDGARFMADIRETFGLQEISFEAAKNASILDIATGLFGALARENSKVAKVQQALAVAETIWNTSKGVMKAMAELPWPANLAAAAKVTAMGGMNVAKIKSTNYGTGSGSVASFSGGSVGGSAAASSTDTNEIERGVAQQSVTQIIFSGDTYGFDDFGEKIAQALKEQVNDRDVVIIQPQSRQALELALVPA